MKKVLAVVIFALCLTSANAQVPMYAVWDYADVDIPDIIGFQVKFNDGAYRPISMPAAESLTDTLAGHKSFKYLIPTEYTQGTNTFSVRACNSTECSWDASHVFKLVGPPKNPRIHKGGGLVEEAVDLPNPVDLATYYSLW